MKSDYAERKEARIERYQELAEKNEKLSNQLWSQGDRMASVIPMGQPILVGHHSERADRNYRAKIDNTFRKAVECHDKAKHYENKLQNATNNYAISSDDPEATVKIKEKLAKLEEKQSEMIAVNKLVRKNDLAGLLAMGYSEARINLLFTPDFCGRIGFADYEVTNNGAEIRRLKKRLDAIVNVEKQESSEREINGVRIVASVEDNRVQMFFEGKPSDETRNQLKRAGFRWSPNVGAWMRFLSNSAIYQAKEIATNIVQS